MTKSEELIHLLNDNAYKSKKCNWYCQKLPKFCNFCYTEASLVKNKETSSNAARLTMDYNLYIWRIAFARKILGEFMSFILHCQYTSTKQILKLTLVFSKLGTFWNVSNVLLVCMTSLHTAHFVKYHFSSRSVWTTNLQLHTTHYNGYYFLIHIFKLYYLYY